MNAPSELLETTPHQALEALEEMGLSDEELAGALGTTPRTLHRWRKEVSAPPPLARHRLGELLRLQDRIRHSFEGPDAVRRWVRSESLYLGTTPAVALRAGRLDRVAADLDGLDSGIFL